MRYDLVGRLEIVHALQRPPESLDVSVSPVTPGFHCARRSRTVALVSDANLRNGKRA
jgi:hypothetical protein